VPAFKTREDSIAENKWVGHDLWEAIVYMHWRWCNWIVVAVLFHKTGKEDVWLSFQDCMLESLWTENAYTPIYLHHTVLHVKREIVKRWYGRAKWVTKAGWGRMTLTSCAYDKQWLWLRATVRASPESFHQRQWLWQTKMHACVMVISLYVPELSVSVFFIVYVSQEIASKFVK